MSRRSIQNVVMGAALVASAAALASGFELDTQSARATAMGTAVTAAVDDASAIFYNPAGIAQGKHLDLQLGDTFILPTFTYNNGGAPSTSSTTGPSFPPNFYAAYGFTDSVSAGIGFYVPYGNALKWPADWVGNTQIIYSQLSSYFITPTVAVKIANRVKLGASLEIVRATFDLQKALDFRNGSPGQLELGAGTWGFGGAGGVQVDITPELAIGATYRSPVSLGFNGNAHFSNIPAEFQQTFKDQGMSTSVTLPQTFSFGISAKPVDAFRLSADVDYIAWQSFGALAVNFDDPTLNNSETKAWHGGWSFHLGGEYAINDAFRLRAGGSYDPAAGPDSTLNADLPDNDRVNWSIGAGYKSGAFTIDACYAMSIFVSRTSSNAQFGGTYGGNAQVAGLSLGYRM